jgi:hypothetical protein
MGITAKARLLLVKSYRTKGIRISAALDGVGIREEEEDVVTGISGSSFVRMDIDHW